VTTRLVEVVRLVSESIDRVQLSAEPPPLSARITSRLRKQLRSTVRKLRHHALRGQPMTDLGPRLLLTCRRGATLALGEQVVSPGDLSLTVQGELRIGDEVFLGRGSLISALTNVRIGDRVRMGERCSVHDANHVFEPLGSPAALSETYEAAPVTIGDRVWLGANTVVLPGVRIGADTVVAANSVVTKSLPGGVLAAGAPAKVLRELRRS
jgi:acetyltransferase-like isoleucine patch superfamily enzyme